MRCEYKKMPPRLFKAADLCSQGSSWALALEGGDLSEDGQLAKRYSVGAVKRTVAFYSVVRLAWHCWHPVIFLCSYFLSAGAADGGWDAATVATACVAIRECLYLLVVAVCLFANPAFLLVDVVASVRDKDASFGEGGWSFLATFVFSPEKLVAFAAFEEGGLGIDSLASAALFFGMAIDFAGVVALASMYPALLTGDAHWPIAVGVVPTALSWMWMLCCIAVEWLDLDLGIDKAHGD